MSDVTQLLNQWREGDDRILDELMPVVYDELRRLAHWHMRRERSDHTLSTTALVHEAYLNLVKQDSSWNNRAHFFAVASRVMRRVLLQYARRRNAQKRGGNAVKVSLDDAQLVSDDRLDEILAIDDALQRLEAMDPRLGQVVEYRYFGGLTIEETSEVMQLSPATIKRDWRTAKAWLHQALAGVSE